MASDVLQGLDSDLTEDVGRAVLEFDLKNASA